MVHIYIAEVNGTIVDNDSSLDKLFKRTKMLITRGSTVAYRVEVE